MAYYDDDREEDVGLGDPFMNVDEDEGETGEPSGPTGPEEEEEGYE